MFKNAVALYENGQFEQAEKIYRQLLEAMPENPEILNLLGLVAQSKGAHSEACSLFANAIMNKPDDVSFYYNLAFSCKYDNRPLEALENFKKVSSLKPEIKETYNEIAQILQQNGNMEEARKNWQYAIALDANYAEAKINLAMSYKNDNLGKAIEDLEKLAKEYPEEALVFYYLTSIYMQKNEDAKAWIYAMKAKELAPTSDEIRVMLALLSCRENNFANARIYFAKAELLNPNNIEALLGLANLDSVENNFIQAEMRYKRVLELQPKNFEAHSNYAEMLQRAGRTAEALEEYRAAVIINPNSAEVSNNLGIILRDIKEYEQALELMFNALAHNPQKEEISANIAETLTIFAQMEKDKAIQIAENWLRDYPQNSFAKHIKAALKGEQSEDNQVYSENLFDIFADNYELVMQNLDYSIPMAMARIAGSLQGTIVDLGCGTGLVGQALKNSGNKIIGVDVSQKMLDIAAGKGVYEQLIKADIIEYLQNNNDFDWGVVADVLGYIGDLEQTTKLLKNKRLLLSIEVLDEEASYKIQSNGRYKHNPLYVEKLLKECGFEDIYKEELIIRTENGRQVRGMIFKAQPPLK